MKIKVKFIDDLKPFKLLYFCEMNDNPTFTYLLVKVLWHGVTNHSTHFSSKQKANTFTITTDYTSI